MPTPTRTNLDSEILGLQAIWVPVARLIWHWFADANYTAGDNPPWSLGANHSQSVQAISDPAHSNGDFPAWERNFKEGDWYEIARA